MGKKLRFYVTVVLSAVLLPFSAAYAGELTVTLDNPPSTGTVTFLLFSSAGAFADLRDADRVERAPLDGRRQYRIDNISPGEYALLVYHDENENNRIDKNFIGIPREPVGFSNGYRPKGPPSYSRAAFVIREGIDSHFDVELARPLGERGRLSVGMGVIARSAPYGDYDGNVYQFIPAITYMGERIQIFGPNVQIGILGSGKARLAATGRYRMGVYEADKSAMLQGMGDRDDTFMVGIALKAEAWPNAELSAGYEQDILNKIGGGSAHLGIGYSLHEGVFRFSPHLGVNWLSSDLSNHDFGVPASKATPYRSGYSLNDTFSLEAGLGISMEITPEWVVLLDSGVELLENEVTESPIVSEGYIIKGFCAVSYIF